MFARFRNLFSKNKSESEVETVASFGSSGNCTKKSANTFGPSETSSNLEGLNLLKSLVENEQKSQSNSTNESHSAPPNSLSEEVTELLKKRLSRNEGLESVKARQINTKSQDSQENKDNKDIYTGPKHDDYEVSNDLSFKSDENRSSQKVVETQVDNNEKNEILKCIKKEINDSSSSHNKNNINSESMDRTTRADKEITISEMIDKQFVKENVEVSKQPILTETTNTELPEPDSLNETNASKKVISPENKETLNISPYIKNSNKERKTKSTTASHKLVQLNIEPESSTIIPSSVVSRENSLELSESSKSLSQPSIIENYNHSATESSLRDLETNLCNNSSIVVEDLPSEITTPSSTVESTLSGSSSNTSTLESSASTEVSDPSKIIVNPIDNNGLACDAITNKLNDIAEVAESLDAVIRDVQENVQNVEAESSSSTRHKKVNTLRSASSEDWHSRSTEEDSFATASEGNFTPSSSSFQTASGRTSSYISCDKNSFDAGEADDSTFAFEMPELTSPLNMSFEGSEHSYLSAQPLNEDMTSQDKQKTPTKLSGGDESSIGDIEELHSESVTPTPEENYDDYHVESIAIESETELEAAGISDAPSMEILTEHTALPMSRTPEVSSSISNGFSNQNPITTQTTVNVDPQGQQNTTANNNNKPNAAWRRSKYYENITKQTIKGFL